VNGEQQPLGAVPLRLWAALAISLALQVVWQASRPAPSFSARDLPPAPRPYALRLASLGESAAAARLLMLYLQAFDYGGANTIPYQKLDYDRLIEWLRAIEDLDPRSDYPLFSAARVYAENPDPAKARAMLEFIYEKFLEDPNRRWPWLAHAALLAKFRLKDLALARRYAASVQRHATAPNVPLWAKQMEIFIAEDMNELEAAKIMLGGLLESGKIRDPEEARFLQRRLEELERQINKPLSSKSLR